MISNARYKSSYSFALFTLCAIFIVFATGCKGTIKQYIHQELNINDINRLAVLPLENLTSRKFADKKLSNVLIMDLLSRGFDVTEPGEVKLLLKQRRIASSTNIPSAEIQHIAKELNVDAVVTGSVGTFEIQKGISVSYPEVSIHLMMISSGSGEIIWSVWHTSGGASFWTRHFGAEGATLDETSRVVVKEAIDTLF